jgi:hypothetical protein
MDKEITPQDVYRENYPEIVLKNTKGYIWSDFRPVKRGEIFTMAFRWCCSQ